MSIRNVWLEFFYIDTHHNYFNQSFILASAFVLLQLEDKFLEVNFWVKEFLVFYVVNNFILKIQLEMFIKAIQIHTLILQTINLSISLNTG
jgi:hypothetical protein